MTPAERTRQQLDPSNTLGSRRGAVVLAIIAVVWAVGSVLLGGVSAVSAPLEILGLLFLVAAAIVVVRASDPLRAPLSLRTHALVHVLLLAGFLAGSLPEWNSPTFFAENWTPATIGLFAVAMSPYRPVRELVAVPSLAAIFIGFVAFVGAAPEGQSIPTLDEIVISVLPILAFTYGSARYTQVTIEAIERRQRRADLFHSGLADELAHTIGRSVQRDRAMIVEREAAPFLRDILTKASISDRDRARAGAIAEAIRGVMVAEADRNWIEAAVLASPPHAGGAHAVHDPDELVADMDQRQRAALRSLVVAASDPAVSSPMTLEFVRDGDRSAATVTFGVLPTTGPLHPALDPYLAVMTAAFRSFAVQSTRPTLIVRFSFDHN